MLNPDFFEKPDFRWCNLDKILYPDIGFSSIQVCDRSTHLSASHCHSRWTQTLPAYQPNMRRGTNWPALSPPHRLPVILRSLVLSAYVCMGLEKHARHSSVYSHKSHTRHQSQRQQGRFYGSEGQQLPADADSSIILRYYRLGCLPHARLTDRRISHADTWFLRDHWRLLLPTSPVRLTRGKRRRVGKDDSARLMPDCLSAEWSLTVNWL